MRPEKPLAIFCPQSFLLARFPCFCLFLKFKSANTLGSIYTINLVRGGRPAMSYLHVKTIDLASSKFDTNAGPTIAKKRPEVVIFRRLSIGQKHRHII